MVLPVPHQHLYRITGVIFAILTFVLSAVIWFPFVKAYDDQKVKEEAAAIKA